MQRLLRQQREDGGWAQTPDLAADAYATGQVLYTLHELGVPSTDRAPTAAAFNICCRPSNPTAHGW